MGGGGGFLLIAALTAGSLHAGCVGASAQRAEPGAGDPFKSVYVINHNDWHTGIAVRRADIPDEVWPEHRHFSGSEYLEVGWGDRDYYQAPDPTLWMAWKAALWPTDSVLHVLGFNGPVGAYFPVSEIVEIRLSPQGFERLCAFIRDAYARDASGEVIELGPGLTENSRFYLGKEKFHIFKNCNVWIARAIRSSGFPITPIYAITAGNVMKQTRKYGIVINVPSELQIRAGSFGEGLDQHGLASKKHRTGA